MAKAKEEEQKLSLPVNHPKAGYLSPDLSLIDGREPPNEEDVEEEKPQTREERIEAREAEAEAVAEAEHKAATEEQEAAAETEEKAVKAEAPAASGGASTKAS
jgi:hypothetical protein